jgi:hypothetical protein
MRAVPSIAATGLWRQAEEVERVMRRSFGYSTGQTDEAKARAALEEVARGFPVKNAEIRPWVDEICPSKRHGFHVRVELDLPEDVEHMRQDVDALVRGVLGAEEIAVARSVPFADLGWQPFTTRDVCLSEYVDLIGRLRYSVLWRLDGETRLFAGPLDLSSKERCIMGTEPKLRDAVSRVVRYVLEGGEA